MKYLILALVLVSPALLLAPDADEQEYAAREALCPQLESFEGGAVFLIPVLLLALIVGVGYLVTDSKVPP